MRARMRQRRAMLRVLGRMLLALVLPRAGWLRLLLPRRLLSLSLPLRIGLAAVLRRLLHRLRSLLHPPRRGRTRCSRSIIWMAIRA